MTMVVQYKAHADGLFQENVQANIGNRIITLFIKLNPPVLTSQNVGDRYLQFRFFDANTNETIKNVSFYINVTEHDQPLMNDLFYTKSGYLTVKFLPGGNPGQWTVYGDHDPVLGGWTSQTDEVEVQAPILSEGGLYHFHMTILALDYANTIVNQTAPPQFDSYLSVGDIFNNTLNYNSKSFDSTIISYYDKIRNFNFDPSKLQISFSMPFDWNPARYQNRPIFVHEEIHVPKSFKEFSETPTYTASVNGEPITGSKLIVDPYSLGDTIIAHILLNKPEILSLATMMPSGTDTMNFTLAPSVPNVKTSSSILTDFGGWEIKLGWNPTQITPNSQNTLQLGFFDAFTEQEVSGDVNYDLKILDNQGNTILSKTNLTAKSGSDSQILNQPGNGIYRLEVNIKSIVNNGIPDISRIGIARGDLVIPSTVIPGSNLTNSTVPEFPIAMPVLVIGITSLVLFYRLKSRYTSLL